MRKSKPTKEQLAQFWNHKINPITGHIINNSDKYTVGQRDELAMARKMKEKFNKE